jgi:hypothetical protein
MSELSDALAKVLDDKSDKNYDPRMEELMRSDRLIDPTNEALSKLEEQEIFHIAKIRGAQEGFRIPVWKIRKVYDQQWMLDYHSDYIDYIRSLDITKEHEKKELESVIGGLAMTNKMIDELIKLRHAEEAWTAKLYADSIKPQVANAPAPMQMQQDQQEGFFAKMINFVFGKKKEESSGYSRR